MWLSLKDFGYSNAVVLQYYSQKIPNQKKYIQQKTS